ncbi:MAG TPA: efflux RND transporter permease subunit [Casimicrobiaceae bacterium]|nr:efflux RND transporter permease subunit [Casimicrobiaceae bacterium]
MNLSGLFIDRPVATTLLTIGVALAGIVAFFQLPVSPLPQVDYPTISVQASLPGASPDTMAATVATPLERALGRIAGVTEMTSSSSLGSTRITLQFELDRDIDGAARDVQAAINAARNTLPTGLPSNPTYRKVNPADAPIMLIALTSDTLTRAQMYDAASTIVAQKLSQVTGIGQVTVAGSALPAVRVELNPAVLNKYGIGFEDVRTAITSTNANRPKGAVEEGARRWQIGANDQAFKAAEYAPIIVAWRNGAPVRLSDLGEVVDSVQDIRNAGSADGKPAVLLILNRQPGANIIETVDRVRALLPQLRASIPDAIDMKVVQDRTPTIRASLREVERALIIAFGLVIVIVFAFLRNVRAALIPSVAVPVSLIGTFGVMYLAGFSLDNLSLMALTVATGFVVDDAIVVLENASRHIEQGDSPLSAARKGAREVGFTVLSMSLSLIAVFIPILLLGGIVGRLFREFAVTLSAAILVSLVVSLTTTPMMCARLLRPIAPERRGRFYRWSERGFTALARGYQRSLGVALRHGPIVMLVLAATVALNVYLYVAIPKGFFPQQDTGRLIGFIQADQGISFQAMQQKLASFVEIVRSEPEVDSVVAFTGGGQRNSGSMFVGLKPRNERKLTADQVIGRLRARLAHEPGASLFLVTVQDIRIGGRQANAQYQYTLQADDLNELRAWEPKIRQALSELPELVDVNTDQQDKGLQTTLVIDRDAAARLGVTPRMIDTTLNDAFGQRQVSTIYNPLNQYRVVMEAAPEYWQSPAALSDVYISVPASSTGSSPGAAAPGAAGASGSASSGASGGTAGGSGSAGVGTASTTSSGGTSTSANGSAASGVTSIISVTNSSGATSALPSQVPLSAFSRYGYTNTPLAVNHQGQFAASTISFNLPENVSLSQATAAIDQAMSRIGVPGDVHGTFAGSARAFQQSVQSQPIVILAALLTIYIVLGVLYESYVHPLTILSTLPSAGVGALLALLLFKTEFSLIALIGVILLIGIVKKNAIMMIDFALDVERHENVTPKEAIERACALRFRPIMMTTLAALLGALPLALGGGDGSELRQPLGISIVGGLAVSQLLTLYTTPVVYLYLDRFRLWALRRSRRRAGLRGQAEATA